MNSQTECTTRCRGQSLFVTIFEPKTHVTAISSFRKFSDQVSGWDYITCSQTSISTCSMYISLSFYSVMAPCKLTGVTNIYKSYLLAAACLVFIMASVVKGRASWEVWKCSKNICVTVAF